jgi:tetratricopeptide (TPR) repeat protein
MIPLADQQPQLYRRLQSLAERHPARAVAPARSALARAAHAPPEERAWARFTLGYAYLCWERFEEAGPLLDDAQAGFEAIQQRGAALHCRLARMLVEVFQRGRADLDGELETLAQELQACGWPTSAQAARMYQAALLTLQGRARESALVLERTWPDQAGPGRARRLRVHAAALAAQGEIGRASALLDEAEQQFQAARLGIELAKCWYEHTWLAVRQERFQEALAYCRRAEAVFARYDLPLRRARCAKDSGYILAIQGAYDEALVQTLQALEYFGAIGAVRETAGCHVHLGAIFYLVARWDASAASNLRAQARFAEAGQRADAVTAPRNRAQVLCEQSRWTEARELLGSAEQLARELGLAGELAEIGRLHALILAHDQQFNAAIARLQESHALFLALQNEPAAASCMLDQGLAELERGAAGAALGLFELARPLLLDQPHYRWRLEHGLARCAEQAGSLYEALEHYRAGSTVIAELRGRLANEQIASAMYQEAARLHSDALRLTLSLPDAEALLELAERQRALTLRRLLAARPVPLPEALRPEHDRRRHDLQHLLAEESAAPGSHTAALDQALLAYNHMLIRARHARHDDTPGPEFDLDRLRGQLAERYGAQWTALVYTEIEGRLCLLVLTPVALDIVQLEDGAALRRMLARAVQPAYRPYTFLDLAFAQSSARARWETLAHLGERLLPDAVRARLAAEQRLLIVPCGQLHLLPWAALRVDGAWLVERAIVQVAPSLTILGALLGRFARAASPALLVGCTEFGGRAAQLPGTTAELDMVARCWPGPHEIVRDGQATRQALLERAAAGELAGCGLLHIASHAQLIPSRAVAAHIKLADDDLWIADLSALRLGGGLVTLSACDGAAADPLPGEEVLSLSWALLASGAGGVLASLWPLPDQDAAALMQSYYRELGQAGDMALALARAQRALIAAGDAPLNWGGLAAIGAGLLRAANI